MLRMRKGMAFCLLTGAALFTTACSSSTPKAQSTTTRAPAAPTPRTSSGEVPRSIPSTTNSALATPPCSASQLHISAGSAQGAAGNLAFPITFRNTSARVCSLDGYPGVSWVTASGAQIGSPASQIHDPASPASKVNLRPGLSASAEVVVPTSANQQLAGCHSIQAAGIKVFLPGGTSSVLLTPNSGGLDRGSLIYCNIAAGAGGVLPISSTS